MSQGKFELSLVHLYELKQLKIKGNKEKRSIEY